MGDALSDIGSWHDAIICYDKSIDIKIKCETYVQKGRALEGLNKYNEALECYVSAKNLNPEFT